MYTLWTSDSVNIIYILNQSLLDSSSDSSCTSLSILGVVTVNDVQFFSYQLPVTTSWPFLQKTKFIAVESQYLCTQSGHWRVCKISKYIQNTEYLRNTLLFKCHAPKNTWTIKMAQNYHDFSLLCEQLQLCKVKTS